MSWKFYKELEHGTTRISSQDSVVDTDFTIGIVATGKSKVFCGHFIRLVLKDGRVVEEVDQRSLMMCLRRISEKLAPDGISLTCAGLADGFYETGLSFNSGWGYLRSASEPIHIMDFHQCDRVQLAKI